ncbi:hypothetical protein [Runella sp.]|uniref:hypothetical protein n=1 Tax=Runella sp. TaxID=1960881 RepID=UPI003D0B8B8D
MALVRTKAILAKEEYFKKARRLFAVFELYKTENTILIFRVQGFDLPVEDIFTDLHFEVEKDGEVLFLKWEERESI